MIEGLGKAIAGAVVEKAAEVGVEIAKQGIEKGGDILTKKAGEFFEKLESSLEAKKSENSPKAKSTQKFWSDLETKTQGDRQNLSNGQEQDTPTAKEAACKTDDNGQTYSVNGKLQPNITYELNGNIYKTDENGRIISCEAKPVLKPENPRDNEAQRQTGGESRKPNDQGGHIVGRDMNGDSGNGNLIAMDSKINQSDYKRMENDIKDALNDGKDVSTKTEITYSGDSERPDKITTTVTIDGKDTVYQFDNNLDGSLKSEVPENGKEIVQERINETGGEISSIKTEYDEAGHPTETTVYITYEGEDGTYYRTSVVVEQQ